MRTLLRVTLRGGDHDIVEARDGDEALALLAVHRPTLAVLDVTMRAGPGWKCAARSAPTRRSPGCAWS